jgi:hypothetical protein
MEQWIGFGILLLGFVWYYILEPRLDRKDRKDRKDKNIDD